MAKFFDSPEMRECIRRLLRAQMAAKGLEYKQLVVQLEALGVQQTESTLRSKVNNGSLGAQLFLYLQLAMGYAKLDLEWVTEILEGVVDGDHTNE